MELSFRLQIIDECESTNALLMDQRARSDFHGACVLARRQTQGVGRRGRQWFSESGNLFLSAGFLTEAKNLSNALIPFTLAIAARNVINTRIQCKERVRFKWPNDLYMKGRKLGGILTQGRQQGDFLHLVVGVGINLNHAPILNNPSNETGVGVPNPSAIALGEIVQRVVDVEEFAMDLLAEWEVCLRNFESFAWIKKEWEQDAYLGALELIELEKRSLVFAQGIEPTGALLVRDEMGREFTVVADEVSLRLVE